MQEQVQVPQHYHLVDPIIQLCVGLTEELSTPALTTNTFESKTDGNLVLANVYLNKNYEDDTAAAAGGVPLGGLYRSGNFIAIRIQ